jgi:hypothetical protein
MGLKTSSITRRAEEPMQCFNLDDPLLERKQEIISLDINTITLEALMKLNEIKRMLSR